MNEIKFEMTESEVKQYVDDLIDDLIQESGDTDPDMESFKDLAGTNVLYSYTHNQMSEETFLACAEYLGIPRNEIDMNLVKEIKAKRDKEAEYRRRYKEKKKAERLAKKKLMECIKSPNKEASQKDYDELVKLVEDYLESVKRVKEEK